MYSKPLSVSHKKNDLFSFHHCDRSLKIWDKSRSEQAVSDPEASDGGREGDAKPG